MDNGSNSLPRRRALKALAAAAGSLALLGAGAVHAQAAGTPEWQQVVEAARKEGKLLLGGPPVPAAREFIMREFAKAYPDIRIEYTPAILPDWPARVEAERRAGRYLWDVYFWGPGAEIYRLADNKVFDPLLPALHLPEVKDPAAWGGWNDAFTDTGHRYVFSFWSELLSINYNAKLIPPGEIKGLADLLKPQYAGKIVWWDPRVGGGGSNYAAMMLAQHGEPALRKLLGEQKPLFVPNNTDIAERMVRGTHPIGLGSDLVDVLRPYRAAGMQLDIRNVGNTPEAAYEGVGYGTVALFNRAPNPNAAKVFINWLLTKETQAALSAVTGRNSRRTDVPAVSKEKQPLPGVKYFRVQIQENVVKWQNDASRIAKEVRP
jgi:iron(III) transport system substrate-binding protein